MYKKYIITCSYTHIHLVIPAHSLSLSHVNFLIFVKKKNKGILTELLETPTHVPLHIFIDVCVYKYV